MCVTNNSGDAFDRNAVIVSFLAVSRVALGRAIGPGAPACRELAASAVAVIPRENSSPLPVWLVDASPARYGSVQANDAQIRREVSQLMKRRAA